MADVRAALWVVLIGFLLYFWPSEPAIPVPVQVVPPFDASVHHNYDLTDIVSPRLAGFPLRAFVWALDVPLIGPTILRVIRNGNKIERVRELASTLAHAPVFMPVPPSTPELLALHEQRYADSVHLLSSPIDTVLEYSIPSTDAPFRHWTVSDYHKAYASKATTPTAVAKKILEFISARDKELRIFISVVPEDVLAMARESEKRWAQGKQIGIFDGVPIAVKDEFKFRGHPNTMGTTFMSNGSQTSDCWHVTLFKQSGAILIGATNMHEIGIGTTGENIHYGTPLNPYSPLNGTIRYYPGGSSSGSAVAVSSGLCPVALSADGGGSIRVPAALSGVYGLKATFSRFPSSPDAISHPEVHLAYTVAHAGPIAASVTDLALVYELLSQPAPLESGNQMAMGDALLSFQPAPKPNLYRYNNIGESREFSLINPSS
eukprot:c15942_g1_i1.p1 GENE.c15942_g1_i1~~c15942_g1_i1.p1  ORF type:complete len:446 (+),score=101.93 c15942_g1_i1:45-1340(+)